MLTLILRRIGVIGIFVLIVTSLFAQTDIFSLMERRDLSIQQIQQLAKKYFDSTGTERGTGYKQYQRWLYEVQYHLDENGFRLAPEHDWIAYKSFESNTNNGATSANATVPANAGPWIEKGPHNWNRTSGWNPGVGRITSLAVHPTDTNTIYIASPGGGIWKTITGGGSWYPLTDFNSLWMNMFAVTIDPNNPNTIYAGSNANVVIKSLDAGATWAPINTGMTGIIRKIVVDPANSNNVFVCAANGIWRSTNGGGAWTRTFTGTAMEDLDFKPGNSSVIYATSSSVVLRSSDAGLTWTTLSTTQGITASGRSLVAVSAANPERVYIAQANGNEFGKLYISNDAGISFTVAVEGSSAGCTNFFGYETTGCGTGGQAGYDMALVANPSNANEIYLAGIIVFKSTDAGKTFAPVTAWSYPNSIGYNHADVHAMEWSRSTIYSGSDGGIFKSVDFADNWIDLSAGLGIRQFYRIANSKSNAQVFTGGAQDNGSSVFNNGAWTDWLGADGMDGIISPANANLMIGTSQNGSIYRSSNGGLSYTTLNRPSAGEWVTPLDIDDATGTMYGGWTGIFKSNDNGDTWTKISGSSINVSLTAMDVASTNANYIYASKGTTLFRTTDGGTTWATTTLPAAINDIEVSPVDPTKVYVACNSTFNRVFVSTNAGVSFTNISDNLPSVIARTIAVDDNNDETIYVGMNIGLFYRNNTTTGWIDITNNLPLTAINDVKIHQQGQLLRVASFGRGVWERQLIGAVAESCGTPANLTVTAVTTTSATVSWDAVNGASAYTVEFQVAGASTWSVAASNLTATSVNMTNLQAGTNYNWRVAAICGGTTGTFSASQFQSLVSCSAPTGLASSNITTTTATINWTAVTGAQSYEVAYKATTATNWIIVQAATTTTSHILSGLTAATAYSWRVKTNCSASVTSGYTEAQFTTAAPVLCNDIYEPNNSSKQAKLITPGTAITAGISTSTDEDWFKFTIGNNNLTNVRVTLSQLPDDYDVYLYDKNFRMVGASSNTGNNNDVIIFNSINKRVTYYVKIAGKDSRYNNSSCYSLQAEINATAWAPQLGAVMTGDENVSGTTVYPNPASKNMSLRFESAIEEKATVTITSATGKVISNKPVQVYKGQNQQLVDVTQLPAGVYFIQLHSGHLQINKQFVVVH